MHKILLVAKRDYLAAIRSKAFLFSLVIAPVMGGGSFIGVAVMKAKPDIQERRVEIVDRTGNAAAVVIEAAAGENAEDLFDKITGRQLNPRYVFETAVPDDANPNAQRLELSDRVRRRELFAFLEIGHDALHPPKIDDLEKTPESSRVDYYSNAGGIDQSLSWISGAVNTGLRRVRLAQLGVDRSRFADLLDSAKVQTMSLIARDEKTGGIQDARKKSELEGFIVPFILVIMLMMTVLFAVGPMLGAVAEDKMQRVFEMLLASATPFELIMGKVVAAVGQSLTSSAVYVVAGLFVLQGLAMMGLAPLGATAVVRSVRGRRGDGAVRPGGGDGLGLRQPQRRAAPGHAAVRTGVDPDVPPTAGDAAAQQRVRDCAVAVSAAHPAADDDAPSHAGRSSRLAAMGRTGGHRDMDGGGGLGRCEDLPYRDSDAAGRRRRSPDMMRWAVRG